MRGESRPGEVYTWVLLKRYLESVRLHFARSWRPAHLRNHNRRFHPVRLPRRPALQREAQATPHRQPPPKVVQPRARARPRLDSRAQRWIRTRQTRTAPRANPNRSAAAEVPAAHPAQPERIRRALEAVRLRRHLLIRRPVPAPALTAPVHRPAAQQRAPVQVQPARVPLRRLLRLRNPRHRQQQLRQPQLRIPLPRSTNLVTWNKTKGPARDSRLGPFLWGRSVCCGRNEIADGSIVCSRLALDP